MQFVMGQRHAVFRARTGEADDVFRTNVRSKDGCADDPPAKVAARQEVIRGRVLVLADDPPGDAQQKTEIKSNHNPVNPYEGGMTGIYDRE